VTIGEQRTTTTGGHRPPARPRSRKKYVVLFVVLLVVAGIGIAVAATSDPNKVAGPVDVHNLPVGPEAPSLAAAKGWINSAPLTPADLKGKVVLYDFWTYSCVNCVRAIPHVRAWYDRYRSDGLVVIGIHSPEFDFEKNHANVQMAVTNLHVDYPVALDDDMTIWDEFANQYWPADYIADRSGHVRDTSIGEGSYTTTEDVIRELLGVPASAPRAGAVDEGNAGKPPTASEDVTPETYLGAERGPENPQLGVATYPEVSSPVADQPYLVGTWSGDAQDVVSEAAGSAIVIRYHAREANLVLATAAPGGAPVDLRIELDGKPLPPDERTAETQLDANGNTYVEVSASNLYRLVLGPTIETHTLQLTAERPDLEAFAFTFSA
jgi:thiol-disulfide isomerase/thioredoxin